MMCASLCRQPTQGRALQRLYSRNAHPHKPATLQVWEHILKADFVKHAAFNEFDVDKNGYIDASDLRKRLGSDANVEALIKQADKNGARCCLAHRH